MLTLTNVRPTSWGKFSTAFKWNDKRQFALLSKLAWTLLLWLLVSSRHSEFEGALLWLTRNRFGALNVYSVRGKVKKILLTKQTRNWLLSRGNSKPQPANVKNGAKNKVAWSPLLFTFHVNAELNLSIDSTKIIFLR